MNLSDYKPVEGMEESWGRFRRSESLECSSRNIAAVLVGGGAECSDWNIVLNVPTGTFVHAIVYLSSDTYKHV
jgi:hypothetical protein